MLKNKNKAFSIFSFLFGLIFFIPLPSHADCTNPASPVGGISYDSAGGAAGDFQAVLACDGTNWVPWAGWSISGYPAPQFSSSGFAAALNDLTDVNEPSPSDGECLKWVNGSGEWQGGSCGGGGGGGTPIIDQYETMGVTIDAVTISATSDKWPDYILCTYSDGQDYSLILSRYDNSSGLDEVFYDYRDGEGYVFNADGTYNSRDSFNANCGASANDIDSICDDDRCGFFGGGGGGSGTPGGSDSQVQYNNGGSFGGDANFVWDDSDGRLGIGDSTPEVTLDVVGDINFTGQIVDVSDVRLKDNIRPLDSPLKKLTSLNGIAFEMKGDQKHTTEYGVSAQDVQEVFPELVSVVDPDNGTLGVNYNGLIAPLIEAVKDQQAQIETLKTEIELLKLERDNETQNKSGGQ